MRSVSKIYRLAIYHALSGHVNYNGFNVPVYDELKSIQDSAKLFILLGSQSSRPILNQSAFIRTASLDIAIVNKTASEVSKDVVDDVEEAILTILFPDIETFGVAEPAGFQFGEAYYESESTQNTGLSQTETITQKTLRITTIITQ